MQLDREWRNIVETYGSPENFIGNFIDVVYSIDLISEKQHKEILEFIENGAKE